MSKISEKIIPAVSLVDQFSRTISYLRLSLTDRCNLRCLYCMPKEKETLHRFVPVGQLLTYEELYRVVSVAVSMGMNKLRLTGGEPLVRKGVVDFISSLNSLEGLKDIRLTTNGVLLGDYATGLYDAGVRNLNISLDTLQPEKFLKITGSDLFVKVWNSIERGLECGFHVKLNVVAMRGVNDDEFIDFARLALEKNIQVRFIEFMPVGRRSSWEKAQFIEAEDIQALIEPLGKLLPVSGSGMDGPARVFSLTAPDGRRSSIGFISPISHHFCDSCNRLRLTSEGGLRSCLLNDQETDLRKIIRKGGTDTDIAEAIRQTILNKPKGHTLAEQAKDQCRTQMSRIGG